MDFSFTEEQNMLIDTIRRFVETEITREVAEEIDEKDEFPHELLQKLCDLGFMGINVPEEYGGQGGTIVDMMILTEETSKKLPVLAWAIGNIILYGNSIIGVNGNEEQKKKYLPRLARGELKFAYALTEPNAGSDAASIQTKAVLKDGYYVLNGTQMFITGAGVADITVTNARTAESRLGGITDFLVDTKSEGYTARPIKDLGYRGSNTCEVHYDDVKVPLENILGGPEKLNKGWSQMMRLLNTERLLLSACALGIGQGAFEYALNYAKEREQFGQPIGKFQVIQHKLVDMATELEAARCLAYYAAWKETQHMECVKETSMSKFFCSEVAKKVALEGVQILGGYGYAMEYDAQRYVRDVLVLPIGGGTTQIQKNIVGAQLGL
ncbi:MAG: acyl-CoA dehydrogenase family protein [Deltaproteobacteria bacterium]|nr:MAG: acyl-CoA dehydrogenase family protein [Deltaproteobacteria bacterium]